MEKLFPISWRESYRDVLCSDNHAKVNCSYLSKYPPPQLMCVTLINHSEPETKDMEIGKDVENKGIREEMGKLLLNHLLSTDLASSLEGFSLALGQYWIVCVQPDEQSWL